MNPKPPHADAPLLFTTYELYLNYVLKYHRDRVAISPRKSILAYKGRMGVENEVIHNIGSRTNLQGNVQIIPKEEEAKHKLLLVLQNQCKHIAQRCKELGWDAVTFQNHTRIGTDKHKQVCLDEVNEILESK